MDTTNSQQPQIEDPTIPNPTNAGSFVVNTPIDEGPPAVPVEPSIVVPASRPASSWLFYIVFLITVVGFLSVSYLLVRAFMQRKTESQEVLIPTPRPTATPVIIVPTVTPTPVDQVVVDLATFTSSTASADIESEIKRTNTIGIEETIKSIDEKMKQ